MPLPTLLVKGNLKDPSGNKSRQLEFDNIVPMDYIVDWVKSRTHKTGIENRFLALKAQTASGKSTANLGELYTRYTKETGRGLICTQPRTLTAIRNVREITANYPQIKMGIDIGHSTKFNKFKPKKFGILSATVGTLAQQLKNSTDAEIIAKYCMICVDETHERDLQIDMTIYMLKNFLARNADKKDCPFVMLMSATFEPEKFLQYFGVDKDNYVFVAGMSHPIDERWDWRGEKSDEPVSSYTRAAAEVVERICRENSADPSDRGDILIFMPGKGEIDETASYLDALNKKMFERGFSLISISRIDSAAQSTENYDYKKLDIDVGDHKIMIDGKVVKNKARRRVIISTNVAETGLTLGNLKYVIDAGYNKEVEFNPIVGCRTVLAKPAPKSRIIQRRGRAGRKFAGVFYPLYPREVYSAVMDQQLPQILLGDLSPIIIDLILEQIRYKAKQGKGGGLAVFRAQDIDMIDTPSCDMLKLTLSKVYALGFIAPAPSSQVIPSTPDFTKDSIAQIQDYDDKFSEQTKIGDSDAWQITPMGLLSYNAFSNIPPEHTRMILAGFSWDCSIIDLVSIASWILTPIKDLTIKNAKLNFDIIYKFGGPKFFVDPKMIYKMRIAAADDFIDGIYVANAVKSIVSMQNFMGELMDFCAQARIKYDGLMKFLTLRDELIEKMLASRVNAFVNESHALDKQTELDSNFVDTITKLKYCIYEGFRKNIAVKKEDDEYHLINCSSSQCSQTTSTFQIKTPEIFIESPTLLKLKQEIGIKELPNVICYNQIDATYKRKTDLFVLAAERVCTMSGFVHVDNSFSM